MTGNEMGRPSSIAGTAIEARVNALLDEGLSLKDVGARTGAHPSSVARYARNRKSQLARVVDDEPNLYDYLGRLGAVADDAREVRRRAKSGSPYGRVQAIKAEVDVIDRMLNSLGVDQDAVILALDDSLKLAEAARDHILHDNEPAGLIERLDAIPGLTDLAQALRAHRARTAA